LTKCIARTAYFFPKTVDEAIEIKRAYGVGGQFIAGGTDLLLSLGSVYTEALIDLSRIPALVEITTRGSTVDIGAAVTYSKIIQNSEIMRIVPLLGQAVRTIGGMQVRNVATLVGNVVNASPAADTLPALYVLNTEVHFTRSKDVLKLPIEEFVVGPGQVVLERDEIVTGISFERPEEGWLGTYEKLGLRKSMAISVASMAVMLQMDSSKSIQARMALGAVAPTAIRVPEAEHLLTGADINDTTIEAVADAASDAARPIDDVRSTADFRTRVIKGLVRRALYDLLSQSKKGEG